MVEALPDLSAIGISGKEPARRLAQAVYRLHKASRRINDEFAATLGIPPADFTAFLVIAAGEQLTPKQLGEELALSTGAITAMLDRLESDGLIQRAPNPTDRRSVLLEVTAQGMAAKGLVYNRYLQVMEDAIERRPEAGTQDAIELLDIINTSVEAALPTDAPRPVRAMRAR